jgi:hypothetical protein
MLLDKDDEGGANSCWSADAAGQLPGQLGGRATIRLTLLASFRNTVSCRHITSHVIKFWGGQQYILKSFLYYVNSIFGVISYHIYLHDL